MPSSPFVPDPDPPTGTQSAAAPLQVEMQLDPCLNLAMQQNGVRLLKGLSVENCGATELREIKVRLRAEPKFAEALELRLASLAAGARHTWTEPCLEASPAFLAGLRERLEGLLHVAVTAGDQPLASERRQVPVLAYDQWGGLRSLPELLCAFVLPNHPAIVHWLQQTAALLEKWSGDPSLSGYQANNRARVQQTAAAVFHALQASGITYVVPPASFERDGQKVRTPDRVNEERLATCLDLAVASAACLEQAGLHALIVLVEDHAFAGVWLDESTFPEPAIEDAPLLAKRVDLGEIIVFDPTLVTSRPLCGFEAAVSAARARLDDPKKFSCAIDVERSRRGGVRPLPLRTDGVVLEAALAGPQALDAAPELTLPRRVTERPACETPAGRIERWKRRLLDLTNRNRLLNFVETKKTVPLECADLGSLEDVLADGRTLTLRAALSEQQGAAEHTARPVRRDMLEPLLDKELSAGRLVTRLLAEELDLRLTQIFRVARQGLEEGGASGLYAALGFLEWFESPTSDRPRRAPLILVPVDLQRGSIRQGFRMTRAPDETRFNTTLVEMLSSQHNVPISGVDPLPEDDCGVDVVGVFQLVRAALRDVPRWRVIEEAHIGFFTFAKFLMWKDLDKQAAILVQNRLVSHLVHQHERPFDPDWREPACDTLDDVHGAGDLHCPVLADSSQLAAVVAAADGRSFVLEGPPGTGKSQTITNLIAHCLARGKTVLFVSEKTAALNVVFDRLKKIGLERFCLELHSNKANKAEVVQRLGEALRGTREHSPAEWTSLTAELDRVRAELNAYARTLGRTRENALSVFRATSMLTALRDAACIDLGWTDIGTLPRDQLDAARSVVREAQNALLAVGEPQNHPLAGVGIDDVAPGAQERIREVLARFRSDCAALPAACAAPASALSLDPCSASLRALRLLSAACRAALDAPLSGIPLIACEPQEAERLVHATCTLGRERDALRGALSRTFEMRLMDLDLLALHAELRSASGSWVLGRWLKTRALRKRLLGVTSPGRAPSLTEMRAGVEAALQMKDFQLRLATALGNLLARSGTTWSEDRSPWNDIELALGWSQRTRASLFDAAGDHIVVQALAERLADWTVASGGTAALRPQLEAACGATCRVLGASTAVADVLRLTNDDSWHGAADANRLPRWCDRIDRIDAGLAQLKPWALWRRLRARLLACDLGNLVAALERGAVRGDQLSQSFERSYLEAWLGWVRSQEPALRDFLSLSHEQRIARFRELDERCTKLASKVVAAKLSARVPAANDTAVPGSELGTLQRQLQLQRKHLGPRQLFQQTRSIVQKLKPCFLMSPISVAQYLPPGELSFDLVVFDEASQIPTWDAVGAIARGSQAVVVGDSKQLPPTSFFDVVVDDDADSESIEELESILDECRAARVPALDLRWHYRSRHESLIAFSNRKYYENRLCTFPAARCEGLGVQWRHVPGGEYDKGRSRSNRVEAEALVAEVLRRLRDQKLSKDSIGIVTFSSKQQVKIEDLLDDARRKDPRLDRFFITSDEVREPVFVKNLENVQGDERDVILFSICYGPDETGRVAMNFGPLNQQRGERRLNVAITRARRELVVFSTLTANQIDLARTRARGVADLKVFLSYAQHGPHVLPAEVRVDADHDDFESPLEREICEALRKEGQTVHSQVGCSGYRIDLAVVDPLRPGQYLLGIECDGANYHSAKTARERDRLRQSVLEGLGWQLIRVWSSDWWEARDEQLRRLLAAIDLARATADVPQPAPPPPPAASAPRSPQSPVEESTAPRQFARASSAVSPPAQVVAAARTLPRYTWHTVGQLGSPGDFYDPTNRQRVEAGLRAVVSAEGPITLGLLASRVAVAFGFERTRQKVLGRVEQIAAHAGIRSTAQDGIRVYWPDGVDPQAWCSFRTSEAGDPCLRDAPDLPVQEVANAAAYVLAANGACPRRDLQRALSRLFGFKALGNIVVRWLDLGIDHLIAEGRARHDELDRLELLPEGGR